MTQLKIGDYDCTLTACENLITFIKKRETWHEDMSRLMYEKYGKLLEASLGVKEHDTNCQPIMDVLELALELTQLRDV